MSGWGGGGRNFNIYICFKCPKYEGRGGFLCLFFPEVGQGVLVIRCAGGWKGLGGGGVVSRGGSMGDKVLLA